MTKRLLVSIPLLLALLVLATSPARADAIIWASSPEIIDSDMQEDIATLLLADPPASAEGFIYAVLDVTNDGSDWIVSLANLTNVDSPYTDWDFMTNAIWADSVTCTGTDPDWVCDYYAAPAGGETGSTSLLFPFKPGTRALYGVLGVHGADSGFLPGSRAVDFVGSDSWGSTSMPAYAYGAANGTVTWTCFDDNNADIIVDSGALGRFLYIHLNPNDSTLVVGKQVYAGRPISSLVYGSFGGSACPAGGDCHCGYASQNANTYHLHFAFIPNSGYLSMGGCNLNVTSGQWVCGTQSIGTGGWLSAGGYSPSPDDNTDPDTPAPTPVEGGESIWDGLLGMMMTFAEDLASQLSEHASLGLENAASTATAYILDLFNLVAGLQLFYLAPSFAILGIYFLIEITRWLLVAIRWILQFIPTMG